MLVKAINVNGVFEKNAKKSIQVNYISRDSCR